MWGGGDYEKLYSFGEVESSDLSYNVNTCIEAHIAMGPK